VTTFYRGTTFGAASEIVDDQALDLERIMRTQAANPGAKGPGVYLTTQEKTANYYADLAGGGGRGLGPAVVRIEVPTKDFDAFARAHGITPETPVPQPPFPGQTETMIPFEHVEEFDRMARYHMHGES
jgi:hypothetical protein